VISNNSAQGDGGAIMVNDLYTVGSLTIVDTVISGNHADVNGGALYSGTDDGSIFITDSTISNNTADGAGGGFYLSSTGLGQVVIANTTISGNESTLGAGAMQLSGGAKVSLLQSTVTNNTGGGVNVVGGISLEADDLTLTGSIVAGNAGFDIGDGSLLHTGSISSQSGKTKGAETPKNRPSLSLSGSLPPATSTSDHSVIGEIDPAVTIVDGGGNKVGVADPMLGPLADNGGPTMTHALLAGSPAIDAGPNPVPTFVGNDFDQRGSGFARIVFGVADAGAFEFQEPAEEPIAPSFTG
jgi:predicted outer membrane repeat protein